VQRFPDRPEFVNALARLYAAAPQPNVRNGARAIVLAQELVRRRPTVLTRETMAMALAEAGRYEEAARWQRETIDMAERAGQRDVTRTLADDLRRYEQRQPCRIPWREDPVWDVP
jgi:hypothetical protein